MSAFAASNLWSGRRVFGYASALGGILMKFTFGGYLSISKHLKGK